MPENTDYNWFDAPEAGGGKDEIIEALGAGVQGAANMLRGMTLDPAIPPHAKTAMQNKIQELEDLITEHF